ncbi:hypothetical protein BDA99DRAFT_532913 [Phascolomyces articulosus]|uniref:Uncharacterized protein n=1 Tax=Phascolomyces articulosus TaxID=60185 RepID=A0AAD5K839_9FUNG|nr:hypothetical protein BDA99DRAFT_532913 [Phascolomyces articulosus]
MSEAQQDICNISLDEMTFLLHRNHEETTEYHNQLFRIMEENMLMDDGALTSLLVLQEVTTQSILDNPTSNITPVSLQFGKKAALNSKKLMDEPGLHYIILIDQCTYDMLVVLLVTLPYRDISMINMVLVVFLVNSTIP